MGGIRLYRERGSRSMPCSQAAVRSVITACGDTTSFREAARNSIVFGACATAYTPWPTRRTKPTRHQSAQHAT